MPTEINGYSPSEETALSSLIINEVDSNETFEKMKDKGLLQDNQLYLVTDGGTDTITPESIGAAPASHASDTTIHVTAEEKAAWDAKADAPKSVSVMLAVASWDSTAKTQTVTVTGVSATETAQMITPTPALASQTAYYEAGILCTGQAADSLTFTCKTVPTADLTVYVAIQEVGA